MCLKVKKYELKGAGNVWTRRTRVAIAAHELIDGKHGLNAFVWSDDEQGNRFMIVLATAPEKPAFLYEANLIDEDADPQLKCLFMKE